MLSQLAYRVRSAEQVLRLLPVGSHTQQSAAARAYATDEGEQTSELAGTSATARDVLHQLNDEIEAGQIFDAAKASAPLAVHQLIGDPRTGIADDTTTAPFGNDLCVEHVWESSTTGTDWFRYSLAGDHLPYMYMDARLSDHSKNMLYMLRCKDPQRWTIPALAEKFRIRRQRVMAILALKEIQSQRIRAGTDMRGPLQHYVFKVPLTDFHLLPDGQPVDLLDLVQQQEAVQQQQQQQGVTSAAAGAAAGAAPLGAAEGLGSLQDFLAPEQDAPAASSSSSSSSAVAAADLQADLAVLMPHVALTAQQLQVQLLQLLHKHQFSIAQLQSQLLQQIDTAEAYYRAHVEGTPLGQKLLQAQRQQHPTAAAAAGAADTPQESAAADGSGEGAAAAAAAGAAQLPWCDFSQQRQAVQQLMVLLQPLLSVAGPQAEREAGQLLVQLTEALHQPTAAAAAAAAAAGAEAPSEQQQQQQQPAGLATLVQDAPAATLAAAFNQLDVAHRQQLLDAVPDTRIKLNIQGVDLQASLAHDSSSSDSSSAEAAADSSSSSSSSSIEVPGEWPGQVPVLVDCWSFEEVPRQQLTALLQQLPVLQGLLTGLTKSGSGKGADSSSSSSSSSSGLSAADIDAVQQAVLVYSGLLREYDLALTQQAAAAVGKEAAVQLQPAAQRRLVRILRDLDAAAADKLLLWESYFKEEAEADVPPHKLRRLKERVCAAVKALDDRASSSGQAAPSEEYPELPERAPDSVRYDKDLMAASLDAEVVGRQFHRGSGDRPFVSVPTYPKFEGLSLQEFDALGESEISMINRLAAERQDNLMWKEFRVRLMRNMGLLGPNLHQHSGVVKPPKPRRGWSWVVHPVGGAAKALTRQQLVQQAELQWLDDDQQLNTQGQAGSWARVAAPENPAEGPAPRAPYVAEPGGRFRQLNEEEALLVGDTRPKPRARWFAGRR